MHDEVMEPDNTAVRVALWRALHMQIDPPPHVLADEVGLRLAAPDDDWRLRPDMDPQFTKPFRASIVGRARYIATERMDFFPRAAARKFCSQLFSTPVAIPRRTLGGSDEVGPDPKAARD